MTADSALLTPQDLYLFNEGSHVRLYEKLGTHPATVDGVEGFPVRRLGTERRGRFRGRRLQPLEPAGAPHESTLDGAGIWSLFVPGVKPGVLATSTASPPATAHATVDKTDPFAFTTEIAPKSAAVTWDMSYTVE